MIFWSTLFFLILLFILGKFAWPAILTAVKAAVTIPVAMKLSPYFSATANMARQFDEAGADALVLFNRFYQPDIDLEELAVVPRVSLSHPSELRLPMRWTAILRPQLGPEVSIAATSGIHSGGDAVKALMVGADVAMMASAVLRDGQGAIGSDGRWVSSRLAVVDFANSACRLYQASAGWRKRARKFTIHARDQPV